MIIIAIDGHSSCGKSTIAKGLSRKLNYIYVDTGAMYRCVTLFCLQQSLIENGKIDEAKLEAQIKHIHITFKIDPISKVNTALLNGVDVEEEIRSMAVVKYVSPVSALKFVRVAMVEQQRIMGRNKGIVMDGRDIGTVVFPEAELKLFVTARPEIRAQRRYDEFKMKGKEVPFEEVFKNLQERDFIDSNRKESPLKQADDAIILDNSEMTIEQQLLWVVEKVNLIQQ